MIEIVGWNTGPDVFVWRRVVLALLLSFGLGQAVAAAYMATFRGLSYSRSTVHSMAMGSVVTCMLMLAVGSSIAAGIGVAGGLTAVRFRTSLRDPRDVIFVFAALAVGMACGAQAFGAAIAGTAVFSVGAWLMNVSDFGARRQPDGLLRFSAPSTPESEFAIATILREHCHQFSLVTLRESAQGTMMEHAYQISVRAPSQRAGLVSSLKAVSGVRDVALLLQEPTLDL